MFSGLRQMSGQAQCPGVPKLAKLISRVITRLNLVNKASVHYKLLQTVLLKLKQVFTNNTQSNIINININNVDVSIYLLVNLRFKESFSRKLPKTMFKYKNRFKLCFLLPLLFLFLILSILH